MYLSYLIVKHRIQILAPWSAHNFVLNDMKVGEQIDQLIKKELFFQDLKGTQTCVSRACFVNE